MKGIQFTAEEKQLLVEALLFTASCDVSSEHSDVHRRRMIELAKRVNDVNQKLHNIYIYESGLNEDVTTEDLKKFFPNLPAQFVITE